MKVFRFMSSKEFNKYIKGENLINETRHSDFSKTNSIGFCFFNLNDFSPEIISSSVSGIVNFEICAIFEVNKKYLNETYGEYHNFKYKANNLIEAILSINEEKQKMKIKEYCTTTYNNSKFKLLRYSEDIWKQHFFGNNERFNWKEF